MGIFDALNTAVTGLSAQSFALQNISGNIANSQTTAFKGTNTQFEDLLSNQGAAPAQQTAGSVIASSSSTVTVQGNIQSTSTGTNMAVNGDGFFVVQKPTGFTGGIPSFNGVSYYTRAGDFTVQDGYLVNGAGYYLMGVPVDPATGQPHRQRAAAAAVSEQLSACCGHQHDQIRRQSARHSDHAEHEPRHTQFRSHQSRRISSPIRSTSMHSRRSSSAAARRWRRMPRRWSPEPSI